LTPSDDHGSQQIIQQLLQPQTLEDRLSELPVWLASFLFHILIMLILALVFIQKNLISTVEIISAIGEGDDSELVDIMTVQENPGELEITDTTIEAFQVETDIAETPDLSAFQDNEASPLSLTTPEIGFDPIPFSSNPEENYGSLVGNDLSGRGENKGILIATGGGSEGSEKAVSRALEWIVNHQLRDGSWTFEMMCGQCGNSGVHAPIAATSMALLPLLGAGHTPVKGKYRGAVDRGIQRLLTCGVWQGEYYSLREDGISASGNMYSHGLATIVLCEAYAMLGSSSYRYKKDLKNAAQGAIRYIEFCQHQEGGWRYSPKQAGDTSVTGWIVMALKSAQMGGFDVQPRVLNGSLDFLKSVSHDSEGQYYYQRSGGTDATTAIGLLLRIYLDWATDNPLLLSGTDKLLAKGPVFENPYYMYYATQLFHHIGGSRWENWNRQVRDPLIEQQCLVGHERGSWFPAGADGYCGTGGRLYTTSLNCMILEVYYRHMPLYQKKSTKNGFSLLPSNIQSSGDSSEHDTEYSDQNP